MSKRLMPLFEPLVEEAIDKISMGEEIEWEIGVMAHPQLGPCWIVALFLPNPIIGEDPISFTSVLANMTKALDPGKVEDALREGLEQLRDARAKMLNAPPPQAPPGAPQGPQGGPLVPPGVTSFGNNGQGAHSTAPGH